MAYIRSDLEGVVVVQGKAGLTRPITLRAGDKVPKGVTVGDHLTGPAPRRSAPPRPAEPTKPTEQQAPATPAPEADENQAGQGKQSGENTPEQPSATSAATADTAGDEQPNEGPVSDRPPASGPGSDKGAWRRYAQHLGIELDAEATRADIQAAVEAHEQQA